MVARLLPSNVPQPLLIPHVRFRCAAQRQDATDAGILDAITLVMVRPLMLLSRDARDVRSEVNFRR